MLSIDYRTRSDATVEQLDAAEWFDTRFPTLHRDLAARGLRHLGLPPLALDVDGFQRTLVDQDGTLVAVDGIADGAIVLGLDAAQFSDFAQELRTMVAFWTGRDAAHGRPGRRLHRAGTACGARCSTACRCTSPAPSPSTSTWTGRSRPTTIPRRSRRSCANAGFLHLRGWLDPADMATIADDIDRAVPDVLEGRRPLLVGDHERRRRPRSSACSTSTSHSPTTLAILDGPEWDRLREVLGGGVDDLEHRDATRTASRRSSSRSAWCTGSPTCRGTATARSAATPTAARARPSASR